MRTPDIEGVATRDGPESCTGIREGAGEALTGVRAGRAIEPRNHHFGVPTLSHEAEGNIAVSVSASGLADPARSENLCMHGVLLRENREIPCSPAQVIAGRAAQGTPRR